MTPTPPQVKLSEEAAAKLKKESADKLAAQQQGQGAKQLPSIGSTIAIPYNGRKIAAIITSHEKDCVNVRTFDDQLEAPEFIYGVTL